MSPIEQWWITAGWPWISAFLTSPGFGGVAAVLAAAIAFNGVRRQTRLTAWWQRAEWALNLIFGKGSGPGATEDERADHREYGLAALNALQGSSLAKDSEREFLADVTPSISARIVNMKASAAMEKALAKTHPDATEQAHNEGNNTAREGSSDDLRDR